MKSNSGVTLLELLLVIILIGILAAILVPALGTRSRQAQGSVALANLPYLATAINTELTTGTTTAADMAAAINGDAGVEGPYGGYTISDQDRYWTYDFTQAGGVPTQIQATDRFDAAAVITATYSFATGDTTFSDASYDPRT